MTKILSLISGTQVHLSAGEKILPAEEFTTLVEASHVLELAHKEAEELIKKTEQQAKKPKPRQKKRDFKKGLSLLTNIFLP